MIDILEIKNLHASAEGKKILKGFSLTIKSGEIHAIMGTNGSGKSTLCNIILNHPRYHITKGSIKFNKKSITNLSTDKIAKLGIFLGFQHPTEIPGVSLATLLRNAKNAISKEHIGPSEFLEKIPKKFIDRSVNEGFSGGEKKRAEIIQMKILEPRIAILDEIDSGLDIDNLKKTAKDIKQIHEKRNTGILLITHYQRILSYITPDHVHIMHDGKIIKSGKKDLANKLEKHGYDYFIKKTD